MKMIKLNPNSTWLIHAEKIDAPGIFKEYKPGWERVDDDNDDDNFYFESVAKEYMDEVFESEDWRGKLDERATLLIKSPSGMVKRVYVNIMFWAEIKEERINS